MANDFIEKNKAALKEEMQESLSSMNGFIADAVDLTTQEKTPISSIIGLAHQVGYLSAIMNQYTILEMEEVPEKKERAIGFAALVRESKNRKRVVQEEMDDSEE